MLQSRCYRWLAVGLLILGIAVNSQAGPLPDGYSVVDVATPAMPKGFFFEVGGMDFAPDGALYVATRTAGVWALRDGKWTQFADGLYDCLGLRVRDDGVYVMQKPELTRLQDEDQDGIAELYEPAADGFRFTGNYHEFAYGPQFDSDGNAYFVLNLTTDQYRVPRTAKKGMGTPLGFRGFVMKRSPSGVLTPYGSGFRSPAGIGINRSGEVFVADNQGDWVGSSYLIHVRPGGFHGHPASLLDTPQYGGGQPITSSNTYAVVKNPPLIDEADLRKRRLLPTVWLPHEEYANSPGNPEFCETDRFGPFKGQLFVGDVSKKSVLRVQLEKVGGDYQGAVFQFVRPLRGGAFRLRFSPTGELYVGQLSRGWGPSAQGIQKIVWDGKTTPFEIEKVNLTKTGFDVTMTKPLAAKELTVGNFVVSSFRYNYWSTYGSERIDVTPANPTAVDVSADRRTIHLSMPLTAEKIYSMELVNLTDDAGRSLVNRTCCYTLNRLLEAAK